MTVFSLNAGKYGPEITPFLDTFYAVMIAIGDLVRCCLLAAFYSLKSIVKLEQCEPGYQDFKTVWDFWIQGITIAWLK